MSAPAYKIEIWEPGGGSPLYTITDGALSIFTKEILTSGIGNFTLMLPGAKPNGTKIYHDLDENDLVKIWLGYTPVPGSPTWTFKGRIGKVVSQWSDKGHVRTVSGLSQGEVFLNRFLTNKQYFLAHADDTVDYWCWLLGLTGEIETDSSLVNMTVKTRNFFDLMRAISDYWVDAGTQVKKDFYMAPDDDHVIWTSRDGTAPFRSGADVESLVVGKNLLSYELLRDKDPVRNHIQVYGKQQRKEPSDGDMAETLTNWSMQIGEALELSTLHGSKVGTYSVLCYDSDGTEVKFKRTHSPLAVESGVNLRFYTYDTWGGITFSKVRLLAPGLGDYFEANTGAQTSTWVYKNLALGEQNVYDSVFNPNGEWTKTGYPSWYDVEGIQFYHHATNVAFQVDGLHYYPVRYSALAEDGTSQTKYGRRDLEITDELLVSDGECSTRAQTLLYQLKDAPVQITALAKGCNNIKVGDRLSMTLPMEKDIAGTPFDVFIVEHSLAGEEFQSKATMINTPNIREVKSNVLHSIIDMKRRLRDVGLNQTTY